MFQNKDKDILGIYKYGCDPFRVSLLTDRHLKVCSDTDFVMISRQRRIYVCAWLVASRVARKKLGHDILRYVSNFRRSERDNGKFYRTGSPFGRQVAVYLPGPTVCTIKNTLCHCIEFLS